MQHETCSMMSKLDLNHDPVQAQCVSYAVESLRI